MNNNHLKIAVIQRRMDTLGGAERLVHDLAFGLANSGHNVDFYTYKFNEDYWGKKEELNYNLIFLPVRLIPKPLRILGMGLYFRFKLRKYDVVNIHNTYVHHWMILARIFNSSFPKIIWYCNEPRRETYYDVLEPLEKDEWRKRALLKYRIKIFGAFRINWNNFLYKLLDKLAIKATDNILANSHYSAGMIKKAFRINPSICHAGIRPPDLAPSPTQTKPYALLVSRMVFHKNIATVIRALATIKEKLPHDFLLIFAGKGPELDALRSLSSSMELDKHVLFTGHVSDQELESLYAHADFFISIPIHEPFGLTLIEAMKYGVPAIGASDGGAAEIIDHEKNGLLVDPMNIDAIAKAMLRFISDSAFKTEMGKNAGRKIQDYYSLNKFVERFEKIVQETKR